MRERVARVLSGCDWMDSLLAMNIHNELFICVNTFIGFQSVPELMNRDIDIGSQGVCVPWIPVQSSVFYTLFLSK